MKQVLNHGKKRLSEIAARKPALYYQFQSLIANRRYWLRIGQRLPFDMEGDTIVLRAHHLFCMNTNNVLKLYHPAASLALRKIKSRPDSKVKVVIGPDDICLACLYWRNGRCERGQDTEEKNSLRDTKFLEQMGIESGALIHGSDLFALMRKRVRLDTFQQICADCIPEICFRALVQKSWWE